MTQQDKTISVEEGENAGSDETGQALRALDEAIMTGTDENEIVRAMLEGELIRQASTEKDPPGYDRREVRSIIETELDRINAVVELDEARTEEVLPQDVAEREHAAKMLATFGSNPLRACASIDYEALVDLLPDPYLEVPDGFRLETHDELYLLERAVFAILKLNARGNYSEVLAKLADAFIAVPCNWDISFGTWSHNLCHVFEKYSETNQHGSVLGDKTMKEANTRMINETVRRAREVGEMGCVDRIVGPLLRYNLCQADPGNLDVPLDLQPEVLRNPDYIDLLNKEGGGNEAIALLSQVTTMRELLVEVVRMELKHEERNYIAATITVNSARLLRILEALRPDLSEEEIAQYMARTINYRLGKTAGISQLSFGELKGNVDTAEAATERLDGLYVDVDGTLLQVERDAVVLSEQVVGMMEQATALGMDVVVFTGGDPVQKTEELKRHGLSERYLPVRSKFDYRGKVLQALIDDTEAEIQAFKALNYHDGKKVWGEQMVVKKDGSLVKEEKKD